MCLNMQQIVGISLYRQWKAFCCTFKALKTVYFALKLVKANYHFVQMLGVVLLMFKTSLHDSKNVRLAVWMEK